MDRERLYHFFDQNYIPKRGVLPRLPLGADPEAFWQEVLKRRKAKGTVLPLHGAGGTPCWYVTTPAMVEASEKIVEEYMESAPEPSLGQAPLSPLEEVFYTSYRL